jgi:oligoendopeptidase F
MAFAYDEVQPSMDTQTLLDTLAQYVAEVDPSLAEPLEFMTEHGLYSFGSGDGRVDGAYTVEINYYQSPYIYMYLDGSIYDFLTLSHEFGHYCNAYFCPETDLLGSSSFDLMEIHSNGLQALMTQWYDQIFTQGADVAEFINLAQMMENIIDGCIQDEFQRRIYDSQEELTAETINRIYTEVFSEYISYEPNQWNNTWLYIPHNFESPLYYISYAASAVAALQIWDLAQTDPQAAADTYMSVLTTDAGENSYTQVLTNNGLRLFSEDGAVSDICQPVLDRMFQLAQNY